MLSVDKISIDYGQFSIHADNLTFENGLHVLIGENGSGKSSLLTGIIGYNTKDIKARKLAFNHTPIDRTADYISYLPQQNIPFQITVEDFIKMTARRRPSQNETDKVLQDFKLEGLRNASADSLSGGEFKRALCAQIHFEDKPVLLCDEIEQGLDINYQHLVMTWLKKLSSCRIVIMAMHDLNLALSYADTVTSMKRGTLTEVKVPAAEVTEKMLSDTFSREMKIIHYEGNIIALS